jgi:hypothetical protein
MGSGFPTSVNSENAGIELVNACDLFGGCVLCKRAAVEEPTLVAGQANTCPVRIKINNQGPNHRHGRADKARASPARPPVHSCLGIAVERDAGHLRSDVGRFVHVGCCNDVGHCSVETMIRRRILEVFTKHYQSHCNEIAAAVCAGLYAEVEQILLHFWSEVADPFMPLVGL